MMAQFRNVAIGITILFATPIYAYSESWIFDLNHAPPPPFLVNNAQIDTIDGHSFWRASAPGIEGQVIYHFTLPPAEKTVSALLSASFIVFTYSDYPIIQNLDSQAYLYVDVSKDGLNWKNVSGFYPGIQNPEASHYGTPRDIGSGPNGVDGGNEIFVRARMYGATSPPIYSRFLTGDFSKPAFILGVETVPEPSTLVSSLICISCIGVFGLLRRNVRQFTNRKIGW
jgi:hypothetical protein